ncbi:hypothetical protein CCYN49044_320001 [Capnocytophaga cynodegmi]|uniref:Uncharacterized protein n=2 Tax=Capnocytophaga cynodegmi TaxID=28189 RepID=A0A0B7HNW6_9FLAO|nr:hypothetical protein CCYN74_120033 [Capnocytophaga cynodegmi]CEN39622.1 hypothetical protein CCYN49044_320001 [Capnocytophaga cynodegmi]
MGVEIIYEISIYKMINEKFISDINIRLETIAIINSFTNDSKTYYIALLDKEENSITSTLRKNFNASSWTFEIREVLDDWKTVLKNELLGYFGQYILQAKAHYIRNEYEGKSNDEFDKIGKKIILESDTSCEFLLDTFLSDIQKIIGDKFLFNKLKVNWDTPDGYEVWYECYENDYLFDLGDKILFLHFGGSD